MLGPCWNNASVFISNKRLSASLPPVEVFILVVKMPIPTQEKKGRSRVKVEKKIVNDQQVEEKGKVWVSCFLSLR